jgi:hypothetical protein
MMAWVQSIKKAVYGEFSAAFELFATQAAALPRRSFF